MNGLRRQELEKPARKPWKIHEILQKMDDRRKYKITYKIMYRKRNSNSGQNRQSKDKEHRGDLRQDHYCTRNKRD